MSSYQPTITGFEFIGDLKDEPEPEPPERPSWEPQRDDVCLNCGGHVTSEFRRVCGDNDDRVHACPNCYNKHGVAERASVPTIGGGER